MLADATRRRDTVAAPTAQTTLLDVGLVPDDKKKRDYATVLAAGSLVAHNIPPFKIRAVMSADFLRVMQQMKGGFPSASHISTACVPDLIKLVEQRFTEFYERSPNLGVALAIDGGAAYGLMDKAKVVVVTASALGQKVRVLMVRVLEEHETAEVQADLIEEVCKRYGITKKRVIYMCVIVVCCDCAHCASW